MLAWSAGVATPAAPAAELPLFESLPPRTANLIQLTQRHALLAQSFAQASVAAICLQLSR